MRVLVTGAAGFIGARLSEVLAERRLLPMQPGDVPDTWADVEALRQDTGHAPSTPVEVGVNRFFESYRAYYGA
jgi:UDP-glucuronate 4-epimerase